VKALRSAVIVLAVSALATGFSAPAFSQQGPRWPSTPAPPPSANAFESIPVGAPPAVNIPIPNISQDTAVWCWAAVAQQVIRFRRGKSPPQCALVAMVNGRYPSFCCPGYSRCLQAGSLQQIQTLIRNFGRRASSIRAPADAMALYRTLRAGDPVILALRTSPYSGHVVVLKGMSWRKGANGRPEAVLHINDPIHWLPPRLSFAAIKRLWEAAIVVH